MEIKGKNIYFKSTPENWKKEACDQKTNTVRFVSKKELQKIKSTNLINIIIYKDKGSQMVFRQILDITCLEKRIFFIFKVRVVIFSW